MQDDEESDDESPDYNSDSNGESLENDQVMIEEDDHDDMSAHFVGPLTVRIRL